MPEKLNIPDNNRIVFDPYRINECSPVVDDKVFVSADWARTPSGDSLLPNASLSGFHGRPLAFEIPPKLLPYWILSISSLKCHTF